MYTKPASTIGAGVVVALAGVAAGAGVGITRMPGMVVLAGAGITHGSGTLVGAGAVSGAGIIPIMEVFTVADTIIILIGVADTMVLEGILTME